MNKIYPNKLKDILFKKNYLFGVYSKNSQTSINPKFIIFNYVIKNQFIKKINLAKFISQVDYLCLVFNQLSEDQKLINYSTNFTN